MKIKTWDDILDKWKSTITPNSNPIGFFEWLKENYQIPLAIGEVKHNDKFINHVINNQSAVYGKINDIMSCKECGKSVKLTSDFFMSNGVICDECAH